MGRTPLPSALYACEILQLEHHLADLYTILPDTVSSWMLPSTLTGQDDWVQNNRNAIESMPGKAE